MIFDLDGTLVQTEKLKALSYARAAVEMCPRSITEEEVIEAFKEVVGRARREVAEALMERFDLGQEAGKRMEEYGVAAPWEAFVRIRLRIYDEIITDPDMIRNNQWPHNIELLRTAREAECRVGLATMSSGMQANRVLEILGLADAFDFVASRDDVEHGKPDPEIYQLVSRELGVPPRECLVIEDSPSGVRAALAAAMWCIAVTTPFTRGRIRGEKLLAKRWIVDEPGELFSTVERLVTERMEER